MPKKKNIKDPREKLKAGIPWRFHFEIDNDVAVKILDEHENNNKAEIGRIINSRLKQAYNLNSLQSVTQSDK